MIAVMIDASFVLVILHSNEKLRVHASTRPIRKKHFLAAAAYRRFFRLIDKGLRPLVRRNWGPSLWLIPFIPFFDVLASCCMHEVPCMHARKVRHIPPSSSCDTCLNAGRLIAPFAECCARMCARRGMASSFPPYSSLVLLCCACPFRR
jgi:hypothetical protein